MSKQSEDDLLADEIEDEGEEDQINKDSLPDERNAHASRQLKDKTAASSEEISQLTHAILGLTKSLPELINSPRGETKDKGKRPASKSPNAVPAKKAKNKDGEARSSTSASDQSTDCEKLYDSVLNNNMSQSQTPLVVVMRMISSRNS